MARRVVLSTVGAALFIATASARAQDPVQFLMRADTAFNQGKYGESADLWVAAISLGFKDQSGVYAAASAAFALSGNSDTAFIFLDSAFKMGWDGHHAVETDSSFASLRQNPNWPAHLKKWKEIAKTTRATLNAPLREELLQMENEDQASREHFSIGNSVQMRSMLSDDKRHIKRLKQIVKDFGWPSKSLVGWKGAHAAWLLVQHADFDLSFQKKCLKLLRKSVREGQASQADLAYLTDRVRMNEGERQIYGTQTRWRNSSNSWVAYPILDSANVDKRRKEVGLGPLSDYLKFLRRELSHEKLTY